MLFNIPQFIDTEDKIVGPFTAKQIGWMIAATAMLFVFYAVFGKTALWVLGLPVLGIFGALAFYRPYGQPLTHLISSIIHFFFSPKMYVWRRVIDMKKMVKKVPLGKTEPKIEKRNLTQQKIEEISKLIDKDTKKFI